MNILVTGGAGFIASHLVDALVAEKHNVIVIDDLSHGSMQNLSKSRDKIHFFKTSITSKDIYPIFAEHKPQVIFHLAAHISVRNSLKDPQHDATTNILGTLNILEHARLCGTQKIIFSSTGGAIYGNSKNIPTPENENPQPVSHYAVSKLSCEHYLELYRQIYGLNYITLRYANVYGPRQDPLGEGGVISIFINNLLSGKTCKIHGSGEKTRDYVYVKDVVRANLLALDSKATGHAFNIATQQETSVNVLFSKIQTVIGSKQDAIHGPDIPGEVEKSCLSISKASKNLFWEPTTTLDAGIKETVAFFKEQRPTPGI